MRILKDNELALLREVLRKRNPSLLEAVRGVSDTLTMRHDQRETMLDIVADELAETGIADGEINARGVLLDDLIDALNDAD